MPQAIVAIDNGAGRGAAIHLEVRRLVEPPAAQHAAIMLGQPHPVAVDAIARGMHHRPGCRLQRCLAGAHLAQRIGDAALQIGCGHENKVGAVYGHDGHLLLGTCDSKLSAGQIANVERGLQEPHRLSTKRGVSHSKTCAVPSTSSRTSEPTGGVRMLEVSRVDAGGNRASIGGGFDHHPACRPAKRAADNAPDGGRTMAVDAACLDRRHADLLGPQHDPWPPLPRRRVGAKRRPSSHWAQPSTKSASRMMASPRKARRLGIARLRDRAPAAGPPAPSARRASPPADRQRTAPRPGRG